MLCPVCGSENIVGNGTVHNGKPKVMCKDCGRQSALSEFSVKRFCRPFLRRKRLAKPFYRSADYAGGQYS